MTVALAVPDVIVARAQAGDEAALEALINARRALYKLSHAIAVTNPTSAMTLNANNIGTSAFHERLVCGACSGDVGVVAGRCAMVS